MKSRAVLFQNVLHSLVKDAAHMVVRKTVDNEFSLFPVGNEALAAQE